MIILNSFLILFITVILNLFKSLFISLSIVDIKRIILFPKVESGIPIAQDSKYFQKIVKHAQFRCEILCPATFITSSLLPP